MWNYALCHRVFWVSSAGDPRYHGSRFQMLDVPQNNISPFGAVLLMEHCLFICHAWANGSIAYIQCKRYQAPCSRLYHFQFERYFGLESAIFEPPRGKLREVAGRALSCSKHKHDGRTCSMWDMFPVFSWSSEKVLRTKYLSVKPRDCSISRINYAPFDRQPSAVVLGFSLYFIGSPMAISSPLVR